jgi:hypothetical protein
MALLRSSLIAQTALVIQSSPGQLTLNECEGRRRDVIPRVPRRLQMDYGATKWPRD